jgi:hypothetical protein
MSKTPIATLIQQDCAFIKGLYDPLLRRLGIKNIPLPPDVQALAAACQGLADACKTLPEQPANEPLLLGAMEQVQRAGQQLSKYKEKHDQWYTKTENVEKQMGETLKLLGEYTQLVQGAAAGKATGVQVTAYIKDEKARDFWKELGEQYAVPYSVFVAKLNAQAGVNCPDVPGKYMSVRVFDRETRSVAYEKQIELIKQRAAQQGFEDNFKKAVAQDVPQPPLSAVTVQALTKFFYIYAYDFKGPTPTPQPYVLEVLEDSPDHCKGFNNPGASVVAAPLLTPATPSQQWKINKYGTLVNRLTGLCLDVDKGAIAGNPLQQWPTIGGPNQRWGLTPDGSLQLIDDNPQATAAPPASSSAAAPTSGSAVAIGLCAHISVKDQNKVGTQKFKTYLWHWSNHPQQRFRFCHSFIQ